MYILAEAKNQCFHRQRFLQHALALLNMWPKTLERAVIGQQGAGLLPLRVRDWGGPLHS